MFMPLIPYFLVRALKLFNSPSTSPIGTMRDEQRCYKCNAYRRKCYGFQEREDPSTLLYSTDCGIPSWKINGLCVMADSRNPVLQPIPCLAAGSYVVNE